MDTKIRQRGSTCEQGTYIVGTNKPNEYNAVRMPPYAKADNQVLIENTACLTRIQSNGSARAVGFPSASMLTGFSAFKRLAARTFSSEVRKEALSTVAGRTKMESRPTTTVRIPSMMKIYRQPA